MWFFSTECDSVKIIINIVFLKYLGTVGPLLGCCSVSKYIPVAGYFHIFNFILIISTKINITKISC